MRKKHSKKVFKTTREMDHYLETHDLGEILKKKGVLVRPPFQRVNLDLPKSIIEQLDEVARKIGVSRQPLLKLWIHERLRQESEQAKK